MIGCNEKFYRRTCEERGYGWSRCEKAILRRDNERVYVDEHSPFYPRKDGRPPAPVPTSGPGTELKALLKKVGIVASPGCSCNTRAKIMDENESKEPGWCEKNLETICDWLQEEATKRKLPFVRMAAKILVRQAIRNARKKGQ